jgi:hypothetical protein
VSSARSIAFKSHRDVPGIRTGSRPFLTQSEKALLDKPQYCAAVLMMANLSEEIASPWVRLLPLRWALGGLLLGVVWSLISSYLQGSFNNPVGGVAAGLIRLMTIIVIPLTVLGLIWGYSERAKLVRSASQSAASLTAVIRRTISRQVGKAMLCGMTFGVIVNLFLGARSSFRWDSPEHVAANLSEALGFVLLAIPLGLAVGYIFRRNLIRKFGAG